MSIVGLLEAISGDDTDWQDSAVCAETDPDAFFPEKGGTTKDAKRICHGCDVRAQCLQWAITHDERFGVWGGLSERERRRLVRGVPWDEIEIRKGSHRRAECGTEAGLNRHYNNGEKPCDDCLVAGRAAYRRRRDERLAGKAS